MNCNPLAVTYLVGQVFALTNGTSVGFSEQKIITGSGRIIL